MKEPFIVLRRDPHGRLDHVRRSRVATAPYAACPWCGREMRTEYQYGIHHDDSTRGPSWDPLRFCASACRHEYYAP